MGHLSRRERERLRREKDMLDAAERIFAKDGYANASVNEIAREAEFSKRTLYQYFDDKSDLYLSVALRLYRKMLQHVEGLEFQEQDGLGKIREIFQAYYNFYKHNESVFRIIYDIGKVRKETDNPKVGKFVKIDRSIFKKVEDLITQGQRDGSINKSLNAQFSASALIFLLTGFFNQLTITGDSFTKHIGTDEDAFVHHVLDLLYSSLKGGQ